MRLGRPRTTPPNDPVTGASSESCPPSRAEEALRTPESVEFMDVEVLKDIGLTLICLVNGKRVSVPMLEILAGSAMRWGQKRGKLVIRRELAVELRLV
jgi:hypothetical protein